MDKNNLITIGAGILIIIAVMAGILYWLADPEPPLQTKDTPRHIIPSFISSDGEPSFDDNRIYYKDYGAMMHGLSVIAELSHTDEMGNSQYREGRMNDQQSERAEAWLNLMRVTTDYFSNLGEITPSYTRIGDKWQPATTVDLSVYPLAVYVNFLRQQNNQDSGMREISGRIKRESERALYNPGLYLLTEHYRNGRFFHSSGVIDHKSMAYGIGGISAHLQAWIDWKIRTNTGKNVLIEEDHLTNLLGHNQQSLLNISREIALVLLRHWDSPHGMYDFESDFIWTPDAIGSLLRGHKALYDMLYIFGNNEDKETALMLYEQASTIFERLEPLIKPWGLPSQIEYKIGSTSAVTDEVNLMSWFQFLSHISGDYAWISEVEGGTTFFSEHNPNLHERIIEIVDRSLLSSLDFHVQDGRLVSSVAYNDGSIMDDRSRTSIVGMFLTAAGNNYANGSSFARASEWNDSSSLVISNTTELYDLMVSHARELELLMLLYE